ncbi:hypothetical protein C5167_036698 [Papaver somniferum]|uniref:Uncharacterized protein n=1 Tax=Papaver somniferum TaxID=3469 RepID=A0A4Y7I6R5_PAPSO|nr:hypothetical protein C5167_036698 [Papaver somniferum]
MTVLLDELIRSLEIWLKLIKDKKPNVNPNLDPVLLVPGIAGSILNSVDENGAQERIWVRFLGADREFRNKLWSMFNPTTGETLSLDRNSKIVVPEDRYGLYAIDCLDPDLVITYPHFPLVAEYRLGNHIVGRDFVCYFHAMIVEMLKWGFEEGKTLFGFGYDFRQSNRLQATMDRFAARLESVYSASGGKKITIISHSMGGLLVKCFMSLHSDIFEKYVKNWIAIAAPFRGAPGYITTSLLNGMSFVEGWEQNFFISKWSMQQLLIECPAIYELMACPNFDWQCHPLLEIWKEKHDSNGSPKVMLESYKPAEAISIMKEALSSNTVNYNGVDVTVPFNLDILKWANETQKVLSSAKVPIQCKFYNIYGTSNDTPHSVCYGSEQTPITDLHQILPLKGKYVCVDGDGTVPVESAKAAFSGVRTLVLVSSSRMGATVIICGKQISNRADGLNAEARVGVPGEHRGIICDRHVFRILKHWLKAGDLDPFYNPLNDYVILPTAFEIEKKLHLQEDIKRGGGLPKVVVTSLKEEWGIIPKDYDSIQDEEDIQGVTTSENEAPLLKASVSVSHVGLKEVKQNHVELRGGGGGALSVVCTSTATAMAN